MDKVEELKHLIETEMNLYSHSLCEEFFRSRPTFEVRLTPGHTSLTLQIGVVYKYGSDKSFYPVIGRTETINEAYLQNEEICQSHRNRLYNGVLKAIGSYMLFADKKDLLEYLQIREDKLNHKKQK